MPDEPSPIQLTPIGYVVTRYAEAAHAPSQSSENHRETGRVVLYEHFRDGLDGLDAFPYAWLLTWLHAQRDEQTVDLRVVPRALESTGQTRGVFATRSPHRVNRLGLSLVRVVRVEGSTVHFTGVDLVDGTPVLDIKPWFASTDSPPEHGDPTTG
ncbi:MAG TPA: tRNA (N6-threonylcarbamoyladenosine(37)-N6)-methyltransferase TrmO [Micromonosporaceae bacterium]|nr:tRNA (N6-threonylcarbamoyladenosine(37)-N6)-methyltransferase TrmO [Micromonosporaceae bacterium]